MQYMYSFSRTPECTACCEKNVANYFVLKIGNLLHKIINQYFKRLAPIGHGGKFSGEAGQG